MFRLISRANWKHARFGIAPSSSVYKIHYDGLSTATTNLNSEVEKQQNILQKTFLNKDLDRTAVIAFDKSSLSPKEFSFASILFESRRISNLISSITDRQSKCAFLASGASSIVAQFAIWMSGQTAVPLSHSHPNELIEYFLTDSETSLIIVSPEFEGKIKPIADKLKKRLLILEIEHNDHEEIEKEQKMEDSQRFIQDQVSVSTDTAMLIYTSGTTAKPKAVMLSHDNLQSQLLSLSSAWNMSSADTILHTLPLHHIHGLINALMLPISVGAKVIMLPKFDAKTVWSHLLNINSPSKNRISVFMGVPTTYSYLINEYDKLFKDKPQMSAHIRSHCSTMIRLFISGSAPLPLQVFSKWREVTGHNLLERYGMTEIGMALSNPLHQDEVRVRKEGFVGNPLPLVQVRIVSYENSENVLWEAKGEFDKGFWSNTNETSKNASQGDDIVGNLQVKGPTIFREYFNKPEATRESFTDDGWFITGDTVAFSPKFNSFKILGRNSVDIIKSRGYKISALEMETKLLDHPEIDDCAVIGISDEKIGQQILALICCKNVAMENREKFLTEIDEWCADKFATYSLPVIKVVDNIPRNLMGKIDKKALMKFYG